MTPQQIEDAARRKYNSVGSSFYAQAEVWDLIYQAECEVASETKLLEGRGNISGGSVAGTQSYAYPSGILEIKRVEYNGIKLKKIDFREDDRLTVMNSNTTAQGTPLYYYDWESTIYLRPIPAVSADPIRLYYYKEPTRVTSASQVLEVHAVHHMRIVDFVVGEMIAKDGNEDNVYTTKWEQKHLPAIVRWTRKRKTGDAFNVVRDEGDLVGTVLGPL